MVQNVITALIHSKFLRLLLLDYFGNTTAFGNTTVLVKYKNIVNIRHFNTISEILCSNRIIFQNLVDSAELVVLLVSRKIALFM